MICPMTTAHGPTHLWEAADSIRERVGSATRLFLFIDFDGTLAPIVSTPALAALPAEHKDILRALAAREDTVSVVISGRSVEDLRRRIGLPLTYVGDGGLEIQGPGFHHTVPGAHALRGRLYQLCNHLRTALASYGGVLVECKSLTATVHFRQAELPAVSAAYGIVCSAVRNELAFRVSLGKGAMEIQPAIAWNKGAAARWILQRLSGRELDAICVGDDLMDEPMFTELADGINVRIGESETTAAEYWLEQTDVTRLLRFLHNALGELRHSAVISPADWSQERSRLV